jgi:hypothetical protein
LTDATKADRLALLPMERPDADTLRAFDIFLSGTILEVQSSEHISSIIEGIAPDHAMFIHLTDDDEAWGEIDADQDAGAHSAVQAYDSKRIRVSHAIVRPNPEDIGPLGDRTSTNPHRIGVEIDGKFVALTAAQAITLTDALLERLNVWGLLGAFKECNASPRLTSAVAGLISSMTEVTKTLQAHGEDLDRARLAQVLGQSDGVAKAQSITLN